MDGVILRKLLSPFFLYVWDGFFRANSISDAFQYLVYLFELKGFGISLFYSTNANLMIFCLERCGCWVIDYTRIYLGNPKKRDS